MIESTTPQSRLTLRLGRSTLSILQQTEGSQDVTWEPFVVKSGVSMAANLREAFKQSDLLLDAPQRARVLLDSDVLMVPVEIFDEKQMEDMHRHAFPRQEQDAVMYNVVPDLNAVAVFSINKDLRLVLDDHFHDVRLMTLMLPVWRHLHQRSFTGVRHKLYAYFHERRLELFAFQKNRFKYSNSFDVPRRADAVYFIVYVWHELGLDARFDELHLVGEMPQEEDLCEDLRRFLRKVMVINAAADFGNHPVTSLRSIPYDLQALVVKGR